MTTGAGRFAPSPSGALHLGNLRTALLAWLFARGSDRRFLIRLEDLDRVAPGAAEAQLADLTALGIDHDDVVVRQSERAALYAGATAQLIAAGLTYECFCTRREIREASSAPQADGRTAEGRYPGTCRCLTGAEITARRAAGRPPALRLRAQVTHLTIVDRIVGSYTGAVEDIVLRRNDGLAAYNLAVVLDDAAQGIDQVVRGDDLLGVTPAQAHLGQLLGLPAPEYLHVPLALNPSGQRLAKRDGAVTLSDLSAGGIGPTQVLRMIAASLQMPVPDDLTAADQLLPHFDDHRLPKGAWIVDPSTFEPRPARRNQYRNQ